MSERTEVLLKTNDSKFNLYLEEALKDEREYLKNYAIELKEKNST